MCIFSVIVIQTAFSIYVFAETVWVRPTLYTEREDFNIITAHVSQAFSPESRSHACSPKCTLFFFQNIYTHVFTGNNGNEGKLTELDLNLRCSGTTPFLALCLLRLIAIWTLNTLGNKKRLQVVCDFMDRWPPPEPLTGDKSEPRSATLKAFPAITTAIVKMMVYPCAKHFPSCKQERNLPQSYRDTLRSRYQVLVLTFHLDYAMAIPTSDYVNKVNHLSYRRMNFLLL